MSSFAAIQDEPVAVLFDRFGPYHHARLRAAAQQMRLLAIEVCGESSEYAWDKIDTGRDYTRLTLFPSRDSSDLGAAECRRAVSAALDAHRPRAVAVPGWASVAALAALGWCARRGRPAVIMSESTAWDEPRTLWKEAVKQRVVGHYGTAGLVGGQPHADYLKQLGIPAERIFLGYNAVDNEFFEEQARKVRAREDVIRAELQLPKKYFLASCRFIEKKNLPRLIAAYDIYVRSGGQVWPMVILGDGPLRGQLEAQCSRLGLGSLVSLPGFKQYDHLPNYYALASGFVHASVTEQWGLVVNEAMASGLPVLVSNRCGCASDLVENGQTGWTFDPEDLQAMAAVFHQLSAMPEADRVAMGARGQQRIAGWSPEAFGEGMRRAVDSATSVPLRPVSMVDHFLLLALMYRR